MLAWLVVAGTAVGPGIVIGAMARIRLACSVLAWLVVAGTAGRPGVVVGGMARYRVTTGHCRQTQLLVVRYNG